MKFKLLLAPFLLFGALLQEPIVVSKEPVEQGFPSCKLDMRKMVDILAEYDVEHQTTISAGQYWGLTDMTQKHMYISNAPDLAIRRLTVLHEFLHVCYNLKAVDTHDGIGEQTVAQNAQKLYVEIYGGDE